jgi:hypothetical protein
MLTAPLLRKMGNELLKGGVSRLVIIQSSKLVQRIRNCEYGQGKSVRLTLLLFIVVARKDGSLDKRR